MNLSQKLKLIYSQFYKNVGSRKRMWNWEKLLYNLVTIFKAKYVGVDEITKTRIYIKVRTKELGNLLFGLTGNLYIFSVGVYGESEDSLKYIFLYQEKANEEILGNIKKRIEYEEKMPETGENY